ncbi:hypothetical protein FD15_GL001535 [Liquorilactobacillus sucicola DSM 21376 = JCM 15457]|uniref:Uncharacterized protein n=2 Tax=Liquorilactobacillus sucicola TaxID=519050 RepID=A0A0R2E1F4_9LACO|nr:hypothetical protein FD15_GL001535 [Liquorilactobacillus sucicola DSM 21376 = JCM 15457]
MLGEKVMDEQLICSECGAKTRQGDAFCQNCGHKLAAVVGQDEDGTDSAVADTRRGYQRTSSQPPKSFNKKLGVLLGLIVLVLLGVYLGLDSYYQPQRQLDRVVTALGSPSEGLAKYTTTDDPTLQNDITDKNLKPTQRYFKENQQQLAALKAAFKRNSTYKNSYSFEKNGNAWLFFPRYKVKIKAAYVKLHVNHADAEVYQNGKKIAETSQKRSVKRIGPLFPGNYTFKVSKVLSGRRITTSSTTTIFAGSKNISLNIETANFTLHGDPGALVYLNNKKIGTFAGDGQLEVTNYPLKGKLKVYSINTSKKKSTTVNITNELRNGIRDFYLSAGNAENNTDGSATDTASSDVSSSDTSDSDTSTNSQVDTKNLTTEQVNDWVLVHLKPNYDFQVTEDDFIFEQHKNDDGLLEIHVRENHDSDNMRAQNASPGHNPGVGSYVIDGAGNLRNSITNEVIATQYGK